MREATDQCRAIKRLEFVELRTVHDAGNDIAHIKRLARVGGDDAVQLVCRIERLDRRPQLEIDLLWPVERATMERASATRDGRHWHSGR